MMYYEKMRGVLFGNNTYWGTGGKAERAGQQCVPHHIPCETLNENVWLMQSTFKIWRFPSAPLTNKLNAKIITKTINKKFFENRIVP